MRTASIRACKGISLEERVGKERAEKIKLVHSKNISNYNKTEKARQFHSQLIREVGIKTKGRTLEEIYGEQKAQKIKELISKRSAGSNNPMYGKTPPIGSGNGVGGYYKGKYFRSLHELSCMIWLDKIGIKYHSAEKKKYRISYIFQGKIGTYIPDLILENKSIVEIKPKRLVNLPINSAKFKAAIEKYGSRFRIITEEDFDFIDKKSLMDLQKKNIVKLNKGGTYLYRN